MTTRGPKIEAQGPRVGGFGGGRELSPLYQLWVCGAL